jgi:hypothetical protein
VGLTLRVLACLVPGIRNDLSGSIQMEKEEAFFVHIDFDLTRHGERAAGWRHEMGRVPGHPRHSSSKCHRQDFPCVNVDRTRRQVAEQPESNTMTAATERRVVRMRRHGARGTRREMQAIDNASTQK